MKWWIRCGVLIAAVFFGIKSIPVIYVNSGDSVSTTVHYVALGDSIACGYGMENPEKDSYVGIVHQHLKEKYDCVIVSNLGCNGQKSEELLDILINPENDNYRKYRASIKYADIITLSIGSNDLLKLIKLKLNIEEIVEEGGEKYEKACREFAENFPKIITVIRDINPDVEIYANNVYNPAKGIPYLASIYQVAEYYICMLNEAFFEDERYHLVDIKKGFDGQDKSMVKMSLMETFGSGEIDPHPSEEGHKLIGELVVKEMAEE